MTAIVEGNSLVTKTQKFALLKTDLKLAVFKGLTSLNKFDKLTSPNFLNYSIGPTTATWKTLEQVLPLWEQRGKSVQF